MEETAEKFISDDLSEKFKAMKAFRNSYLFMTSKCKTLQNENFNLKNLLEIAKASEKQKILEHKLVENTLLQQDQIIRDLLSIKGENSLLKDIVCETKKLLENAQKEIDEIHLKSANELKSVQQEHECELVKLHEQYLNQATITKESFEKEKQNMENIIKELKMNIEAIQKEKNVVMEVTIKEYEGKLQMLKDSLEESMAAQKSLEDRNNANMNTYKKKLEDQEHHYISMLENVRQEVSTTLSSAQSNINNQVSTNSHILSNQGLIKTVSWSHLHQPILTNHSQFFKDTTLQKDVPVNKSYYDQLHLPPPQPLQASPNSFYSADVEPANVNNTSYNYKPQSSERNSSKVYEYIKHNAPNQASFTINRVTNHNSEDDSNNYQSDYKNNDNSTNNKLININRLQFPTNKKRRLFHPQNQDFF